MRDGRLIRLQKQAELEHAYRDGKSATAAARVVDVCRPTAVKWFLLFAAAQVPRREKRGRSLSGSGGPYYCGPDWIGKPAENERPKNGAAGRTNF